ncbi:uncharacterized protein LOC8043697 isoform X3 [Ixodes scapularis]|uniref:uncharacterized protein LOC8043697 isoform X3 n=1 Tax=Ixodes scapularis TaxID=6945 RepID=UPI001A9F045D|nr:uncharacterized protein LOC8043697 isoform X3 [Ixodes scapularis]
MSPGRLSSVVVLWAGPNAYEQLLDPDECKDPNADPGRGMKKAAGGLGRLFRTLGSKKDKCKTSPRHLSGRLRPAAGTSRTGTSSGRSTTEAPLSPAAGLGSFAQPAAEEEVLNDDCRLQLVLAVREGQMTSEQALHRLRQRETLRFRNHRNREELLNDLARNFVFSQGTSKKANSVFYTDGGLLPSGPGSCRSGGGVAMPGGVPASQPIYYEPPDAVDLDSCTSAAPAGLGSPLRGAVPAPAASDRCCVSAAPGHGVLASPFRTKAPPILAAPPYGSGTATTEVCDGNCGNIMCSVRASADSPPSEPPTTTMLPPVAFDKAVDGDDGTTTTVAGEDDDGEPGADVNDAASRTVPDVAHDSELKRAALAAAAASAAVGSDNVRAPTPGATGVTGSVGAGAATGTAAGESSANVRSVTMLGKLRGITQQNRNSFSASEEGQSQSSDYEDQDEVEKQMGDAQKTQDQQLRNSLVGRVRHLHKDVKKKISRFRNSRSSVDGSDDNKDMADDSLHPGSSIESIPSGSAGSRSSIQAHTPTSSNRSSSSIGEEECNPQCFGPFVGRARALVDCVPSPYDKDGLSFKKGDIIDILSRNTTGTWVGVANKKVGHFKFINVEEIPTETKPRQRRFPSVPKLDHRPESLEELLGMFGLQNYLNVFMLHGYQDFEMFKEVTKDDLDSLGITNEDHQLQIFRAAETLLEHDGEILGEYLEVPVSPELPAVKESDGDGVTNTAINDLDSVADSIPQNDRKKTFLLPDCDASFTSNGPLRFQLNIPLAEPDVSTTTTQSVRDFKETICNGSDVSSMTVFSGPLPERFELRRASTDCIRSHLPRSLQNVFRKFSGSTGDEDGRSASFDENETLSESPAKISYGSSFARKVKASSFLRRDSMDDASMADVLGKKGSRGKGSLDNVEESAPLSLRACIEHKLAAEGIDLCQEPYTDRTGFCGIPPALVQRYSEELQKDIADTAEALDQVRISELDRIGKRGVPNDFLADSCGGPIVEADYTGLRAWLVSLGLPMYEPLFLEARISTLARVADLREPDFRTLGISNARHVRLLSSAVGALHFEQSRYSLEVR